MAENKDNNITSVMEALIKGAETVFTTKTVVGEATKVDGYDHHSAGGRFLRHRRGRDLHAGRSLRRQGGREERRRRRHEREDVSQRGAFD